MYDLSNFILELSIFLYISLPSFMTCLSIFVFIAIITSLGWTDEEVVTGPMQGDDDATI